MNSFTLQPQGFAIRLPIEAEKRKMPTSKTQNTVEVPASGFMNMALFGNHRGIELAHADPGHADRGLFAACVRHNAETAFMGRRIAIEPPDSL